MCHRIHEESETSKTIADNTRSKEDLYMYQLFWPMDSKYPYETICEESEDEWVSMNVIV